MRHAGQAVALLAFDDLDRLSQIVHASIVVPSRNPPAAGSVDMRCPKHYVLSLSCCAPYNLPVRHIWRWFLLAGLVLASALGCSDSTEPRPEPSPSPIPPHAEI